MIRCINRRFLYVYKQPNFFNKLIISFLRKYGRIDAMISVERTAYTAAFITGFILVSLAMPVTATDLAKEAYKLTKNLNTVFEKMRRGDFLSRIKPTNGYSKNEFYKYSAPSILLGYILGLQKSGGSMSGFASETKQSKCGVSDTIFDPNAPGEYRTQSKWTSKLSKATGLYTMKYTFANRRMPWNIKFQDFQKIVTLAMCSWELIANVRFRYVGVRNKSADVSISFEKGDHGDGYPFDGRGGTLGHAFYPEDGRVHLDIMENWYIAKNDRGQPRKSELYTTVLHELGHTIGLKHSKNDSALMSQFFKFRGVFESFEMPDDDIAGAESLYGKRRNFNPVEESYSACGRAHSVYSIKIGNYSIQSKQKLSAKLKEKVCQDHARHAAVDCPKWKLGGLCDRKTFERTLKMRCPKTCGFCTVNTNNKKTSSDESSTEMTSSEKPKQDSLTSYDNDEVAT